MTLTKSQIIEEIRTNNGFSRNKSIETVETLLGIIKQTLASGEDVMVSNFGKFQVKYKEKWRWRNHKTGKFEMIPRKRRVTFKCSRKLRDKINE